MNHLSSLASIRQDGHQQAVVASMPTREELHDRINYHALEQSLDRLAHR